MKKSKEYYIFIDLENLPHLTLEDFDADLCTLYIFLGAKQAKIPDELEKKTREIGKKVHWIRMAKSGKNNLDFHLTFQMGQCHEKTSSDIEFVIMSDDTGFDPLVQYINQLGRPCQRMTPYPLNPEAFSGLENEVHQVKQELWLKNEDKRPASENKLKNHIAHFAKHQKLHTTSETLYQGLIREGFISVEGKKITYHF